VLLDLAFEQGVDEEEHDPHGEQGQELTIMQS
jgi:hypothetical protein